MFSKRLKILTNLFASIPLCTIITACVTGRVTHIDTPRSSELYGNGVQTGAPITIKQISSTDSSVIPRQINQTTSGPQLSVEQLATYLDRCAPNQTPAQEIDCSELSLKIKRVLKANDRVADALTTLYGLGRSENISEIDGELSPTNRESLSSAAQAVASGLHLATPTFPTSADQSVSTDEIEQFLDEIGLVVNSGAIGLRPPGE